MLSAEEVRCSSPWFRRLSSRDLDHVATMAIGKTYEKGEHLFFEGEAPAYIHALVQGRVKVTKGSPSGREVILEIFGPGDPVGAVVAYEGLPYPASAIALERTRCLLLPRADFFDLLASHPTAIQGFLSGMARRIVELTRRIPEVAGGRVETRFAILFLKLGETVGRPDGLETLIPMPLTRQELADLTGTTIETAIRVMSRWSRAGLVATEAGGFRIRNREAIAHLARS